MDDEDLLDAIVEAEERAQILTMIVNLARRRCAHGEGNGLNGAPPKLRPQPLNCEMPWRRERTTE